MQLVGIVLLYLIGLSGSDCICGKKRAWSVPYRKIVSRR